MLNTNETFYSVAALLLEVKTQHHKIISSPVGAIVPTFRHFITNRFQLLAERKLPKKCIVSHEIIEHRENHPNGRRRDKAESEKICFQFTANDFPVFLCFTFNLSFCLLNQFHLIFRVAKRQLNIHSKIKFLRSFDNFLNLVLRLIGCSEYYWDKSF